MKNFKLLILGISIVIGSRYSSIYGVDLVKLGMFGAGFAAGTVFHELGHAATGIAQGGSLEAFEFQGVGVDFGNIGADEKAAKMRIFALGGYAAQSLATEVIINQKDWHHNDFALGWMSLGIVVNLSNPIRYYVFGQKDNDLGLYEKNGGNPAIPAALMVAHAGWTLYRIFNDTDIPLYIVNDALGITLKF